MPQRMVILAVLFAAAISAARLIASLLIDSGQIAYHSNADGDFDLYLLDVRTAIVVNLTRDNPDSDANPAWSPDGRLLAFESVRGDRFSVEIFTLDLATRAVRQITRTGSNSFSPTWSPDGDQIAFVLGYNLLRVIDLDGTHEHLVARGQEPDWSGDDRIVYSLASGGRTTEMYIVPALGGDPERPLPRGVAARDPDWSPDSRWIAFVNDHTGPPAIFLWDTHCRSDCMGDLVRLTEGGLQYAAPDWSPDGTRLVYNCEDAQASHLCIMEVATRAVRYLVSTPAARLDGAPAWRPKG